MRSVATLREELGDLDARLDKTEANTANLPHRRKYLLFVIGFLRRLLQLYEQFVEEIERELGRTHKPRPLA